MSRDWTYIADILDAGQAIQNYLKDIDRDSFDENALLQDAIQLRVIVIGEATKRLSMEFRNNHPGIAWKAMAGMRDILIHDYDKVDLDLLWDTSTKSIPEMIAYLEPLLPPDARPTEPPTE